MKGLLRRYGANFYVLASFFFLIWVLFIDSNDFFTQLQLEREHRRLQKEKSFYERQTSEIRAQHKSLTEDEGMLERIARERFLLKRLEEDVFIIERQKKKDGMHSHDSVRYFDEKP